MVQVFFEECEVYCISKYKNNDWGSDNDGYGNNPNKKTETIMTMIIIKETTITRIIIKSTTAEQMTIMRMMIIRGRRTKTTIITR